MKYLKRKNNGILKLLKKEIELFQKHMTKSVGNCSTCHTEGDKKVSVPCLSIHVAPLKGAPGRDTEIPEIEIC